MDDFATRGFETHAISLRGHGASATPRAFNLCGLRDYLGDLEKAIAAIEPRPVVVGHSLGGYVTQFYLTEHQLPGAVLLCSAPAGGFLRFLMSWAYRHPVAFARGLLSLNTRHMVGTPALARDAFFRADIDPVTLESYVKLIVPESLRVATEGSLLIFPKPERNRNPVLVIAAEKDRIFTLTEQRALATAYDAELVVVPETAHDLMLDPGWDQAADAIERAVTKWTEG